MKNRNPLTSKEYMKTPRWFSPDRFFSILRIPSGRALLSAATAMGLMAVLTVLVAGITAPAASGDPPVVTTTITNFSNSVTRVNPCTGGTGTVTNAGQDVLHITEFGNGIFLLVDTQTATLTFVPDDPNAPTLVGHYTTTFAEQSTPPGQQLTVGGPLNVVAVGEDGSRVSFHIISRTTRLPDGTVIVSFDMTHLECVP